jgi:hypothetical protein
VSFESNEIALGGIPSATNALKLIEKFNDQIPFATALALTRTAGRVSEAEVEKLRDAFTLRREWYKRGTRYGINVKAANKRTLTATVFSRAPWLVQQSEGDTKDAGRHDDITIPEKSLRQTRDRLIPQAVKPGKVLANMKKFRAFRIGDTIFRRNGLGIRALFFLKSNVRIPKRFDFKGIGKSTVEKVYQKEFGEALAYAIATSKP